MQVCDEADVSLHKTFTEGLGAEAKTDTAPAAQLQELRPWCEREFVSTRVELLGKLSQDIVLEARVRDEADASLCKTFIEKLAVEAQTRDAQDAALAARLQELWPWCGRELDSTKEKLP